MAIDLVGIPVVDTDFLKSGFRVKFNKAVDKMIVNMSMVDGSKLRVVTRDGSYAEIDLSDYFYTIDDVNELLVVPYATEEKAGKIRIATMEEVEELDRNDLAVTPYTLGQLLAFYNGRGYMAAEELLAGDFVTFFFDEEEEDEEFQWKVKKAIALEKDTLAIGFVVDNVDQGDMAPVKLSGNVNDNVGPLEPGKWYYLRSELLEIPEDPEDVEEPYQISTERPSDPGTYVQQIGYAVSETELMVELHPVEVVLGDVFEDLPALVFVKGIEMTVSIFLEDYLIEGIDPESLTYSFRNLPSWITSTQVVFNNLSFTGQAPKVGDFLVDMVVSGDNASVTIPLQVEVVALPNITAQLTPGGTIKKGELSVFDGPDTYSMSINIDGDYDAYQIGIVSSGFNMDTGFEEGQMPSSTVFSGQALDVRAYILVINLWKQTGYDQEAEEPIYTQILNEFRPFFIGKGIGEGDPERIINAILQPNGIQLSSAGAVIEHDPGGTNVFFEPVGLVFDSLSFIVFSNGSPSVSSLLPTKTNVTGSVTNEKIDTVTGVASADPDWRATSLSVSEGERYWTDGDIFLYDGATFVEYIANAGWREVIIPSGVDILRTNKEDDPPIVEKVDLDGLSIFPSLTDQGIGEFSISVSTNGYDAYDRVFNYSIVEAIPEPVEPISGLTIIDGTGAVIGDANLSGSIFLLPSNGFNFLLKSFSVPVDKVEWTHEIDRGGWAEVDIQLFTGLQPVKAFEEHTIAGQSLNMKSFFNKDSRQIGTIHEAPSRQRATFKGYLEGELVEVIQADVIFSDKPLGGPSGISMAIATIEDTGSGDEVTNLDTIDANVPDQGGAYSIPAGENEFWVGVSTSYDGITQFKRIVAKVNGVEVGEHTMTSPDTELPTPDLMDFLLWDRSSGLDQQGEKVLVYEFYDASDVLIGSKEASFYLFTEEPEIKDPTDCCDDKCDTPHFIVHDW